MSVLLIGTLDTKGTEIAYVRQRLVAAGVPVIVADAGVMGPSAFEPDVSRQVLFALAGADHETLKTAGDRGAAIEIAARGAARLAIDLFHQGKLSGVLSLGGSAGTTIGTAAMRAFRSAFPSSWSVRWRAGRSSRMSGRATS